MSDAARSLLEQMGRTAHDLVPLKGALDDDARQTVWLARHDDGLSLVAEGAPARVRDVDGDAVRYRARMIEDTLTAAERTLTVPTGRADEVQRVLGLGRLVPRARSEMPPSGRHIESFRPVERAWLRAALEPDERVLVWLHSGSARAVASEVLGETKAAARLLLTTARAGLVAVNAVGDALFLPLGREPLRVDSELGRGTVRGGGLRFSTERSNESLYAEIAALPALGSTLRLREVARLNVNSRGSSRDTAALAGPLLERLADEGDPVGVLAAYVLGEITRARRVGEDEFVRAATRLKEEDPEGESQLELCDGWGLTVDEATRLLEALTAHPALDAWAVPLHARVHRDLAAGGEGFTVAAVDIALAEHLLRAGHHARARVLLEDRLAALPSEELEDLLPPAGADLTEGAGGQMFRVRVLELLERARGKGEADAETRLALARLQPLVPARLEAVIACGEDSARRAARNVRAILEPGGLSPLDDDERAPPDEEIHRLLDDTIGDRLRHPAARTGHAMERLQSFIAEAKVPDHSALKAYCERLSTTDPRHAEARGALSDAAFALGLRGVDAYVSRGERSVGVRAYEGRPSFVVIGGRHLDAGSEYALHPWELRFVLGAEMAHLRFGHARVTASDVWQGAWSKGKASLDFVVGMLPVLKGWKAADRLAEIVKRAQNSPVGRVLKGVGVTQDAAKKVGLELTSGEGPAEAVAARPDELIAAHRVMQLTADRAGLVLCDDIGAAVRAMFLTDPESKAELSVVERHGLARVLGRRNEAGEMLFQSLAIRICALVSFYLSDEYGQLRRALSEGVDGDAPRRTGTPDGDDDVDAAPG